MINTIANKKYITILLAIMVCISLITVSVGQVYAESPKAHSDSKLQKVGDKVRLDKYSEVEMTYKGSMINNYELTVTGIPKTLDDLTTAIDTKWYRNVDSSGQVVFTNGENLFHATVNEIYVSITDISGRLYTWNTKIEIGNDEVSPKITEPTIVDDPINKNYKGNCLSWNYGATKKASGIVDKVTGKKDTANLTRYIRVIEGFVQEIWVFDSDPDNSVSIYPNVNAEDIDATVSPVIAFDSTMKPSGILKVTKRVNKYIDTAYDISASEFNNKKYPVYIDPDLSFNGNTYDGYVDCSNSVYATAHDTANGEFVHSGSGLPLIVGQAYQNFGGPLILIERSSLIFDTSSLPDNCTVNSAVVGLYNMYVNTIGYAGASFNVIFQTGSTGHPSTPLVVSDYNYTYYSGNGGMIYSGNIVESAYNYIPLNSTGLGWISKTSYTKFMMRTDEDINSSAPAAIDPANMEWAAFYCSEYGIGYQPTITISYSLPATTPTVVTQAATGIGTTGANLNGYVSGDGGADCSVSFEYGLTTSYGSSTAVLSGYNTNEYFTIAVVGLSKGTTYHFRSKATNSSGTGYGSDLSLMTLPDPVSNTGVTPGNETNALSWTKGAGTTNTLIRYRTDTYPSSVIDGTQLYLNTGTSTAHNGLTGGTTYYYSFWSVASNGTTYSTSYAYNSGTPYSVGAPTIVTNAATNIGVATARMNGYISDTNQIAGTVSLYFEYGTSTGTYGAPVAATPATINYNEYGQFVYDAAGLAATTPYFFRVKAVGTDGTSYGAELTFTTGGNSAPTITTESETAVTLTSFNMNGTIDADGGLASTAWFQWGTVSGIYPNTTNSVSGLTTGSTFYYTVTGLVESTNYYYRAVAQNTSGITYGAEEAVTTNSPVAPTVSTSTSPNVGANSATITGTLLTSGGVLCEVEFEWGLTNAYGNHTGFQAGFTNGQSFSAILNNLDVGQTYHFVAVVKNSTATVYGDDVALTTLFTYPQDFSVKAITSTTASFTWEKQGDATLIIMKKQGFPIDRTDGDQIYLGGDSKTSYSGLLSGTTYYFRAWSQRSGDVWADGYAEDAVTMPLSVEGETTIPTPIISDPSADDRLYQDIDTSKLVDNPFYGIVSYASTTSKIPEKTLWFLLAFLSSLLIAILAGFFMKWNTYVIGIGFEFGMIGWSLMTSGVVPMWVPILIGILLTLIMITLVKRKGV